MADDSTIITDDIRAAGRAVLQRMDADPDYAARLVDDPVPLLLEAGIPEGVMPALAAGILDNAEVSGFRFVGPDVSPHANPTTVGAGTGQSPSTIIVKNGNPTVFTDTTSYGRSFWYS
jgi:hypothetical protein